MISSDVTVSKRFHIRTACSDDGKAICELIGGDGWGGLENIDWGDVNSSWIVAERDGIVIGCVAMLAAKPIGHAEHLGLLSSLSHMERARVVSAFLSQIFATLRAAGCAIVMTTIPDEYGSYIKVLKNRGGKVVDHSAVMIKRLV